MQRVLIWLVLGSILLPFWLLGAVVFYPWLFFAVQAQRRRERRFCARLRAGGRFLPWPAVVEHLSRGEGTFLVEQANKQSVRFWWSADDVAALAPAAPPDHDSYDYIRPNPQHPFVSWCFARYTSPASGSALLTKPELTLPPGPVEESFLLSLFPRARIVFTILAHPAA